MSKPEDGNKAGEIKRLLERLHELSPTPDQNAARQRPIGATPRLPPPPPRNYYDERLYGQGAIPVGGSSAALQPSKSASLGPWLFVLATALNTIVAAVLAVLITLGVVRQEPSRATDQARGRQPDGYGAGRSEPRQQTLSSATATPVISEPGATTAPARAVRLWPIGSPQEPLRLEARKPARLPLRIEPEDARRETFILVLTGLPVTADLAGADRIGINSWLLGPDSIGRLELTLPEWSVAVMEVGIELRRTNGVIAAQTKAWLAVPPPPSLSDSTQRFDEAGIKEQMQRAEQLLARGDVAAARALYERLAEMGSAAAAMSLAATYDPKRLWSLGVFGMIGNKERARQWYTRADQLGHAEAKERLRALD
jgi:hypothetical protein